MFVSHAHTYGRNTKRGGFDSLPSQYYNFNVFVYQRDHYNVSACVHCEIKICIQFSSQISYSPTWFMCSASTHDTCSDRHTPNHVRTRRTDASFKLNAIYFTCSPNGGEQREHVSRPTQITHLKNVNTFIACRRRRRHQPQYARGNP